MKHSPFVGFEKCIMLKCLNLDIPKNILTEELDHSTENENHSRENEGLIPNEKSNCSSSDDNRDNTHLKSHSFTSWFGTINYVCDGPATNAR